MSASEVSATLFARDYSRVAAFYREALGFSSAESGDDYCTLRCDGFELLVLQIPKQFLQGSAPVDGPPERREMAAIRLDFRVDDIEIARAKAAACGGQVDASPPPWAGRDSNTYLGYDPEGNVFKVSQRTKARESDGAVIGAAAPTLSVVDVPSAIEWYQKVLGFEVGWIVGTPPHMASLCREQAEVMVADTRGAPLTISRVYFETHGVEAYHERVVAAGGNVTFPLADRPYGMRDFRVEDPSGNQLSFGEPLSS